MKDLPSDSLSCSSCLGLPDTAKHQGIELCPCHSSIKVKIMFLSNPSSSILDCMSALFQICHVHEIQIILALVMLLLCLKLCRRTAGAIFCFDLSDDKMSFLGKVYVYYI